MNNRTYKQRYLISSNPSKPT